MYQRSILKSASIIGGATFLSRSLGFVRDILIAQTFGVGWFAQAFFVAFRIPNMFRDLAGEGASNAAFVPVFSEYLVTKERRVFWRFVNTVFIAFVICVSVIVMIGVLCAPLLVRMIAPGFLDSPEKFSLTVALNRPLFVYLILIATAAFCMGVLHAFKSFLAPALFPSMFNLVFIASIMLADNSQQGIWILIYGVLCAGVLQVAIQLPALIKRGFRLWPFEFERSLFRHESVRRIGRLLAPRILGTALYQLNILVDTIFASFVFLVGAGAIAAIYYATRLIQFPLGLFGHAISNATLPTLSEYAARRDHVSFSRTVEFGLSHILWVMIPASCGLVMLAHPMIHTIFERGAFSSYSTQITATALAFYAIGLAAYGANKFFALCFNALQDTVTPVKISGITLASNVVLNIVFVVIYKFGIAGLALASSISALLATFVFYRLLMKRLPVAIPTHTIFVQLVKVLVVSAGMVIGIAAVWSQWLQHVPAVIGLVLVIGIGIIIYLLLSVVCRVRQAKEALAWISRRLS